MPSFLPALGAEFRMQVECKWSAVKGKLGLGVGAEEVEGEGLGRIEFG